MEVQQSPPQYLQPNLSSDRTTFNLSPSPEHHHHYSSTSQQSHLRSTSYPQPRYRTTATGQEEDEELDRSRSRSPSPYSPEHHNHPRQEIPGPEEEEEECTPEENEGKDKKPSGKQKKAGDPNFNYGIVDETKTTLWDLKDGSDGYRGRPPYPYLTLIRIALLSSEHKKLTLQELYDALEQRYPFFKGDSKGWKNSIRHTLSLNRCFKKEARGNLDPGKGSYWYVDLQEEHSTPRVRDRRKTADGETPAPAAKRTSRSVSTAVSRKRKQPEHPSPELVTVGRGARPKLDLKLPGSGSAASSPSKTLQVGISGRVAGRHRAISAPSPITASFFSAPAAPPHGLYNVPASYTSMMNTVGHPHPIPYPHSVTQQHQHQQQPQHFIPSHPQHPYFYNTAGGHGINPGFTPDHISASLYHYPHPAPHPSAEFQVWGATPLPASAPAAVQVKLEPQEMMLSGIGPPPPPPGAGAGAGVPTTAGIEYSAVPSSGGSLTSATTVSTLGNNPETPRSIFSNMLNKSLATGGEGADSSGNDGSKNPSEPQAPAPTNMAADGRAAATPTYSFPVHAKKTNRLGMPSFKTFPPVNSTGAAQQQESQQQQQQQHQQDSNPLPAMPAPAAPAPGTKMISIPPPGVPIGPVQLFSARRPLPLYSLDSRTNPSAVSSDGKGMRYSPPPSAGTSMSPTRLLGHRFSDELFSSAPFGLVLNGTPGTGSSYPAGPAASTTPNGSAGLDLLRRGSRSGSIFGLSKAAAATQ